MDHERQEDKRTDPPSEGVRIIGAEEAAEALERGDVAQRRGGDQPRYGDRPHSPTGDGPRPVLRFPLGSSSDPRDIERPVVAAQDPISEQVELPHWTEPATGQVPQILPDQADDEGGDLDDWASFASSTPRWRDDATRHERDEAVAGWGDDEDEDRLGALDTSERPTHDDYFTFADLDDAVAPGASVFAIDEDDEGFGADWAPEPDEELVAVPYDERASSPYGRAPISAWRGRGGSPPGTHRTPQHLSATWGWRRSSAWASLASR